MPKKTVKAKPQSKNDQLRAHPHHYHVEKNLVHRTLDWGVPILIFGYFYFFYNNQQITPVEMIKTTGLWSITLLALTLVIGPISKFLPFLEVLKANRKIWGILSFLILATHMLLVVHVFWKWDLTRFFAFDNPRYPGIGAGLAATLILLVVTLTSFESSILKMSPRTWKIIQTTSVLALILAFVHFFLMESKDWVLTIKRAPGQYAFWFVGIVVAVRILMLFIPRKK
jgi:DMSO/TMAO reductase YedYZ heme-binding membrane subunit